MAKDYYKVLDIARNASKDEVKKAYRRLAHKFHPDKGGDEKHFKEISEAYQILSDERKRAQYDQFGEVRDQAGGGAHHGGFEWPGGFRADFGDGSAGDARGFSDFDFSDVFEDFLGGSGGGAGRRKNTAAERGRNLRIGIEIPFEESIMGAKKGIELARMARCAICNGTGGESGTKIKTCQICQGKGNIQKTQKTFLGAFTQVSVCPECRGEGNRPEQMCHECRGKGINEKQEHLEVFIPRGMRDGEVLKITGKGDATSSGRTAGDLYIEIHVLLHPLFRRQGDDIIMRMPLKISQAVLGDTVDVQTLDGGIRLKIPEGTQPGDILSVRGRGAWHPSGYGRGDLLVEIKVEIPKRVSKHAKETIQLLTSEGF
ncbi:MAG: molecular chaperone DnaJ [Candidatus Sungiibacteriota bacterium]